MAQEGQTAVHDAGVYRLDRGRRMDWAPVGISVRAHDRGQIVTCDLAHLDADSVARWARANPARAGQALLVLLKHRDAAEE